MQYRDLQWLKTQYLDNQKTAAEIALLCGAKKATVQRAIYKAGLKKNREMKRARAVKYERAVLEQLYTVEGLTAKEVAERLGTTKRAIQHAVYNYELKRKSIKVVLNEAKVDPMLPEFCYFAGLVATDGNIDADSPRVAVRLADFDRDILDTLQTHFETNAPVRVFARRVGRQVPAAELLLPSKHLVKVLADSFCITPNKTNTLRAPKDFHNEDCLRLYLRGVVDGDGSIRVTGKHNKNVDVRLACGSEAFVDDLILLIEQAVQVKVKKTWMTTKSGRYAGFHLGGERGTRFITWLYKGYTEFCIARKKHRAGVVALEG